MRPPIGKAQALIAAAVLGVGAFVIWRAWRAGKGIAETAAQVVEQAAADATSAWRNNVTGPIERGWTTGTTGQDPMVTEKTLLYSNVGYTGNDQFGAPVISGDWFGNEEARRYEYQLRDAGAAPAAVSTNGAAFGIYPSAGRRRAPPPAPIGAPISSP